MNAQSPLAREQLPEAPPLSRGAPVRPVIVPVAEPQPVGSPFLDEESANVPAWVSISDYFEVLGSFGARPAMTSFRENTWCKVTYAQLVQQVERRARYLLALDLRPQDSKLAMISESHPEWLLWALGAMRAGIILVPLDARSTAQEVAGLLKHSEATVLFHSTQLQPVVQEALSFDRTLKVALLNFDEVTQVPDFRHLPLPTPGNEDTAVISYTSGTFAQPKGVMTRFGALIFQASTLSSLGQNQPGERMLSHLPMNHLYEFTTLLMTFAGGIEHVICERIDSERLRFYFANVPIQKMNTVPLLLETLEKSILANVSQQPRLARTLFALFFALARFPFSRSLRKRIFKKIHDRLGGALERVVAGGAPLKAATARFFQRIGVDVYQGYGLTETGPVITVHRVGMARPGTVGFPLPAVEVLIHDPNAEGVGEIRTRGPHLMKGYFKAPELTAECFDAHGYFKTGDLGYFDSDGHLRVCGRIKKLIVLNGGKKVQAEEVEAVASSVPFVTSTCAFPLSEIRGENVDGLALAVALHGQWLESRKHVEVAVLEQEAREAIAEACKVLSPYKRPTEIFVFLDELPKTATQKVSPPRTVRKIRERLSLS